MMTAMVAAVMPTVMPTMVSKTTMAAVVPKAEADKRRAVTVTIEPTPPIMAAVVSAVMAVSRLLHHVCIFEASSKSAWGKRCRIW